MVEKPKYSRRRLFGATASTVAAARLGTVAATAANPQDNEKTRILTSTITPGAARSFERLKQIDAGVLNVGYAEDGPLE